MRKSAEQILSESHTAINNALSDRSIRDALLPFGYTEAKFQEGQALYRSAQELYTQQISQQGVKAAAHQAFREAYARMNERYAAHVQIARIAFKTHIDAYQALGLRGERKAAQAARLSQAHTFYTNALSDAGFQRVLAAFGVDSTQLSAGLSAIGTANETLAAYKKASGAAQEATKNKNAAVNALRVWVNDLIALAKIAFADDPQRMEALGVVMRR